MANRFASARAGSLSIADATDFTAFKSAVKGEAGNNWRLAKPGFHPAFFKDVFTRFMQFDDTQTLAIHFYEPRYL